MTPLELLVWLALVAVVITIILELLIMVVMFKVARMFGWRRSGQTEETVTTDDFLD